MASSQQTITEGIACFELALLKVSPPTSGLMLAILQQDLRFTFVQ